MEIETSQTSSNLPSLLCEEDESCFDLNNETDEPFFPGCVFEYDDDYIEKLIHKESNLQSNGDTNISITDSSVTKTEQSWLKRAHFYAVQWILDTGALFGFHFKTVYLSLMYFHGFFSKRSIEDGKLWAIRLLSIACLSIAAKMEEYKAPALSEFQIDEYNFEVPVIQRMEFLVLETLDWRLNIFTPFDYFPYFIAKFCGESRPERLISRAIELTLDIVKDTCLVKYPPSMIAAVAVLVAYDSQLTKKMLEFKIGVISSWGSSQRDNLLSCYNLMQAIQKAKSNTPLTLQTLPNLSFKCSNSSDCLDSSSTITLSVGSKRRLVFTDSYQNQHLHKTYRLR